MVHHLPRRGVWGGKGVTQEPFDLDLGKKVGNLDFWEGGVGYSATSDLDLGKKVGNLDFWEGGGGGRGSILQLRIWT